MLTTAFLLGFTGIVAARVVRIWSYQELLEKSDLVVLATPTATNDTKEHIDLPGFVREHVIGVETRFAVSALLKGDEALRDFALHHYRTTDGSNMWALHAKPVGRIVTFFLRRAYNGRNDER
jgi:hypothetical protein